MTLDCVSQYLAQNQLPTKTAYFQGTGLEIGRELNTEFFKLIYNVEGNSLIICDLSASRHPRGIKSAIKSFITLLRAITNSLISIQEIKGMILDIGTQEEQKLRIRMAKLLIRYGAKLQIIDNNYWLIFNK